MMNHFNKMFLFGMSNIFLQLSLKKEKNSRFNILRGIVPWLKTRLVSCVARTYLWSDFSFKDTSQEISLT